MYAIYCRKSPDAKREEKDDAPSVAVQENSCREFAHTNNLGPVAVYVDDNKSGKAGVFRKDFERLKEDIDKGTVKGVIMWRSDRPSRDQLDLLLFNRQIRDHGVISYSVTEGGKIDLETAAGRMFAGIRGVFGAYERELAAERVKEKKRFQAQKGKVLGGRYRNFGYADRTKKKLHKDESKYVAQLFEMWLAGSSIYKLHKWLNDNDIRTVAGNKFDPEGVKRILRNASYAGIRVFDGEIVNREMDIATIITPDQWERSVRKLDAAKTGERPHQYVYLLSGILYCTLCHATLVCNRGRYICSPSHRGCGKIARTMKPIDDFMLKTTAKALSKLVPADPDAPAVEDSELTDVREEMAALSDAKAKNIIPMVEYLKQYGILRKREETLISKMDSKVSVTADEAASFLDADIETQRAIIKRLFPAIGLKQCGRGKKFSPEHLVFP